MNRKTSDEKQSVLFPWQEEHGEDHIHPKDVDLVRELQPAGKVLFVEGQEDEFMILSSKGVKIRVKNNLVKPTNSQAFPCGTHVSLQNGQEGIVIKVMWHYKESQPFYTLEIEGRQKSKRYWNDDFVLM